MKVSAAKIPTGEFFRHFLTFSGGAGGQAPAANAVRKLGAFRALRNKALRRARWAIQAPDGRIVPGTKSETADIAWDRVCWPSYTRNDFEADGWKAVKL